ncbi:MAG: type I-E CRISPR-associated protein Cse1/CasA, partial [Candidatus Omnitrophota bacterium]
MSSYNLIDEPWIPVRDLGGNLKELGIKEVLLSANNLASIEDQSPLVTASLYRFLLAVLYRALKGPCDIDEAKKLFREGFPGQKITAYLEKWRSRFFLFDEKYPFGQVPEYEPMVKNGKQNWRSWTALAAEHNADNAKVLFDHVDVSASGEMPLKQTARWLFACNTFVLGGGNSDFKYTKDAPSSSSAMAIPIGKNLQDTLIFCLVPQNYELTETDIPLWERDSEGVEFLKNGVERSETGYADLYTWRSRSIRFKEKTFGGISKLALASGIGYVDSSLIDPMVGYKIVDVKNKETDEKVKKKLPLRFEDRGIWRDFDSLLPDGTHLAPL